jgi:hypothetical protein
VWFLRIGLADGSGAWWFRYLLMNPGRSGCAGNPRGMPVQVWATWFPVNQQPRKFIQEFALEGFDLSARKRGPFHFRVNDNAIDEDSCRGSLAVDGHTVSWNLRYRSTFRVTLSNKGWIGFSRTPHSDAVFSGEITFDGQTISGDPLGFGVQGHNCGYRHRNFWTWAHAYFPRQGGPATTMEALTYEMPFGLVFRKAVLWHDGRPHVFRDLRAMETKRDEMQWRFGCASRNGIELEAAFDGGGPSVHHLPYVKTDCSGSFDVRNNSLASASLVVKMPGQPDARLRTKTGAVLEIVG